MEAEGRFTEFGSSLKVPNVQEMAKGKLSSVPARYVRHDPDHPTLSDTSSLPEIPVIDMEKLLDSATMESELQRMHNACQEWGFFQLINHGVDSAVVENTKSGIQNFFNLSMKEKMKFSQKAGEAEGYGHAFVVSDEQTLDWGDLFFLVTLPTYLRKPHLIPNFPPTFRDAMDAYSSETKTLAMKILELMAKALNMKTEDMKTLFEEGLQSMRINFYPPCPNPELVTGICPHSDASALTLLLQVNEMEGLQIKKDGAWIPVSPLPNAFVVNVGDVLEMVTNGVYRSIEHKGVVNSEKERLSIATFLNADLNGDVGPAPSILSPKNPPKFKRIGAADYMKGLFSREPVGKTYLDDMRI
ncbi:Iron/ascorbate family oxidoreductase [Handroanthus impetiginosus]|uniref:Iron/ascorbate family oxidoreductase n=1 Tax=Handroanthus impetiginosus TaxID=429701 RepID=A0A2G9GGS2_9LAMI|nr:Iron/ascorbate family oxidoreductase [Handroanthus impetiginosus]